MRLGHGHWRSVLILWAWTALLSGFVLYPTITGRGNGIVPIGILAMGLLLFTVLHPTRSRRSEVEGEAVVGPADESAPDGAEVVDLAERRASGS